MIVLRFGLFFAAFFFGERFAGLRAFFMAAC